ncbi:hypothetical protein BP5796_13000 [Coleophoma crateriformis]|uniref:Uncharacterized protein n=1 Tax=Coleophoma crateriformis TaxID=565419 RepID=A0A3D8Q545_9HELO|nr:hypothetical protein BP5796_13000 [Coleophoma crateriformis]
MATGELPKVHRALVQRVYAEPLQVEVIPTPQPTAGSAVVKVLFTNVISYMGDIYNGTRKYSYPTPLVAGCSAIGRIAAVGADATLLKPGQLVLIDSVIRGRDDPTAIILSGIVDGVSEGSRKLMQGEWRDSTYAEYVKAPLENCFPLDESRLCGSPADGGLGYDVERLMYLAALMVPFGGLRDIGLEAGETVIIAPATGHFGGAAVFTALAMGARVIAMGRNAEVLGRFKALSPRVETVRLSGNEDEEVAALQKFGPADAFFDISPPQASDSTHIKSAFRSLRHAGRVSFMGGLLGDVKIPYAPIMLKDIKIHGKWMYSREDAGLLVKMVEIGLLSLEERNGITVLGTYPLDEWKAAFDLAAKNPTVGQIVLLRP